MLFNKKFDLAVSIGEDCACTSYLRRYHLQDCSYPFDWLTKADLNIRIELLITRFNSFLELENLNKIEKKGNITDHKCDYYEDIKTGFYFYHDFPCGQNISVSYPAVKEKYDRRINRLYNAIEKSGSILFVWWSRLNRNNEKSIVSAYQRLQKYFDGKDIYILSIEYGEKKEIYLENRHILFLNYDNVSYKHNIKYNETMGNESNNAFFFRQIKIKRTLRYYCKLAVYKCALFFVNLFPAHKIRVYCRNRLKQFMFHSKL